MFFLFENLQSHQSGEYIRSYGEQLFLTLKQSDLVVISDVKMIFNCFCHQAEKGSLTLDLCDLKLPGTVLLEECLLYVSVFYRSVLHNSVKT